MEMKKMSGAAVGGKGKDMAVQGGMPGGHRPEYIHGSSDLGPVTAMATNNGRQDVMIRGPGQMAVAGPDKGKAMIANTNILKLACSAEDMEGKYR